MEAIMNPGTVTAIHRHPGPGVQYHYVWIDFLCRRVAGDLAAASDAAEVRWFRREDLPALKLAEDTRDVILKGFAKVKAGS